MVHYGFVRKCHLYGASLLAQMLKILPAMQEALVQFPGSGRSPGEGNSNLLYCSCLENSKKKKKKRKENSMNRPWGRKETRISYMRSVVIPTNCFQMIQQKIKYINIF